MLYKEIEGRVREEKDLFKIFLYPFQKLSTPFRRYRGLKGGIRSTFLDGWIGQKERERERGCPYIRDDDPIIQKSSVCVGAFVYVYIYIYERCALSILVGSCVTASLLARCDLMMPPLLPSNADGGLQQQAFFKLK